MSELHTRRPPARTRIVSKSAEQDHTNTDLPTVIAFSLIGLLLARTVMLCFPELGALIAQYNQF
jgi:hypothetical protein